MGRKSDCERKSNRLLCYNLSDCQRVYLQELAEIATIQRDYTVSQSLIISEIIGKEMRNNRFSCENFAD